MKHLFLLIFAVFTLSGCAIATRTSIPREEASYQFTVKHSQPKTQAFNKVELALAESYVDLPRVLKLKQPETGTYLLKPLVDYMVGGCAPASAPYTLKIVVESNSITLNFELGPDTTYGNWAPVSEIPKIRANFRAIASKVAQSVGGTLQ